MPKLRAVVTDPNLGSVSFRSLSLAVKPDGKARVVEFEFAPDDNGQEPVEVALFRELCNHHHQLGEPELVPDKPQPAAKAETAEKE